MKSLTRFVEQESLSQLEMKEVVGGAKALAQTQIKYIYRRPIIGTDPATGKKYAIPNTTVIGTNPDGSVWSVL